MSQLWPISMQKNSSPSLVDLLKPYAWWILLLTVVTILANGLNLAVPQITSHAIDAFGGGHLVLINLIEEFSLVAMGIALFTFFQNIVQTYASEKVARDLRTKLSAKISKKDFSTIETITPAKLLTNLTSDVDAVKNFVSQAIASIISSFFLIIGACTLLLLINWKLALAVIVVLPVIAVVFFSVLTRVRVLFKRQQEIIDWLNKVISESIFGAALVRLLDSHEVEYTKFVEVSGASRDLGLKIIGYFSLLIPTITFISNIATLIILSLGGYFVIGGTMTLGDFTAFNNYLLILIFPILIIGFMSNVIAQASASYGRISEVLDTPDPEDSGTVDRELTGTMTVSGVSLTYGERSILKDISFSTKPGTKTAIIGPTAAGKTQLLYLLTGLLQQTEGTIKYDGDSIESYKKQRLHEQVGFVFQDSIIFNLTLRENIAFSTSVTNEFLEKALDTAELHDFINDLPEGLDTVVSERGSSLSGGQKQRIMLARALALNPKILLLDDFTARVDTNTERKILAANYPGLTLISVTQKIAPIENYDQIILLMEGEVLAEGTHTHLMETSPEYVQIYDSQKSTENYE
jgi:ATP-binding cassette subfamily B protein